MTHSAITKERVIRLRQKGLSYSEILNYVSVSHSTLSLWLRDIPLDQVHVTRLALRRRRGNMRGAQARHIECLERSRLIRRSAIQEVKSLTKDDLRIIGAVLYWAEGSKENNDYPGSGIAFSNQDSRVIRLFLKFLIFSCDVKREDIYFELYIHSDCRDEEKEIVSYWSAKTGFPADDIKVYYKHNTRSNNRQNYKKIYHGVLRVRVRSSSELLRRIQGWTEGISRHWGVV